jgi:hypothetical protein
MYESTLILKYVLCKILKIAAIYYVPQTIKLFFLQWTRLICNPSIYRHAVHFWAFQTFRIIEMP